MPVTMLINAPPITSWIKCTPERTLVIAIIVAIVSIITPSFTSRYKNAIAIINADAV